MSSETFDDHAVGDPDVDRSLLDSLLTDSKLYSSSESYQQLLQFVSRMRNVAPFNAMLLQLQKPGLTYAASAFDWQDRFGRQIKEDARPLLILWPFGPVATVYDILDTEGDPLPEDVEAFFARGDIDSKKIGSFQVPLQKKGIEWVWIDVGDAVAGLIRTDAVTDDKDESRCYLMKINRNHPPAVQFTTMCHELAHLFLGHLGANKKLNIPSRRSLDYPTVEIEAESVAYLLCIRNGVMAKSETYLSRFVKANTDTSTIDVYQIMRAAGQIESVLGLTTHTRIRARD